MQQREHTAIAPVLAVHQDDRHLLFGQSRAAHLADFQAGHDKDQNVLGFDRRSPTVEGLAAELLLPGSVTPKYSRIC